MSLRPPLKLEELNEDCIEHIIRGFRLDELIKVAGVCKLFRETARTVFKTKFRNHEVFIFCDPISERSEIFKVTSDSRQSDQRLSYGRNLNDFLECFGKVISKLNIYDMNPIASPNLGQNIPQILEQFLVKEEEVNENAAEDGTDGTKYNVFAELEEITFRNCGNLVLDNALPFKNATKITFDRCVIASSMEFGNIFPHMTELDMVDCNVGDNRGCIGKPLGLENLNVISTFSVNSFAGLSFKIENIKAAMEQNPGIKNLNLCYWNEYAYDAKLLKYAALNLPYLKSLHLWHLRYTEFNSEDRIDFPTVSNLVLSNHYHAENMLRRNLSALSFPKLTKFVVLGQFDADCLSFAADHVNIKKLVILPTGPHPFYPTNADIEEFGNKLRGLKKIIVNGKLLTALGLVRFISQSRTLISLIIRESSFSPPICKLFQYECSKVGWNYSRNSAGSIVLKRRLY